MTEIHDQSYRRYRGERVWRGSAWTVIAATGIRTMIGRRKFLGLLILSWLPFVVRAVQIYVSVNFPQAESYLGLNAEGFRQFLEQQGFFIFLVTIYAGAGLIANDRRANALQIYLSKPMTRAEYIAGKLAILVVFLLLVTWVPAIMLLIVQVVFRGSFTFLQENLFLVPAITLFALLQVLLAAVTMLAMSSLSNSSRYAGILYAGIVFFTDAMFSALRVITGGTMVSWISFPANLAQVGDVIFRLPPRYQTPWAVSLVVILGLMAVSLSVLDRRVRGVEVVS